MDTGKRKHHWERDDGIAVAYALAILAADDIPHPALEASFYGR